MHGKLFLFLNQTPCVGLTYCVRWRLGVSWRFRKKSKTQQAANRKSEEAQLDRDSHLLPAAATEHHLHLVVAPHTLVRDISVIWH